jgi:glycyl-tRNA synthetase beta chain
MRWGSLEVRFVRAIRSLVSLLDERVVEFEVAGVRAGRNSFGHRFLGARVVPLARAQDYVEALRREHVVVEVAERRRAIEAELHDLAGKNGGVADPDLDLIAEVIHLVEEPHVVAGRFDPAYLELPPEVLVTSIKHHQKGFPIWAEPGQRLAPAMLAVANIPDVEGHVARGTERVLNARLADARFFWREDRKIPLVERLPKLERVVFHEKLGTYAAKTRRLEALAPLVAHHLGLGEEAAGAAAAAASRAKADLVTGMVGEFAELQGVIGGLYLAAEGAPAAVARAVYEHYLPLSLDGDPPGSAAGRALSVADKIDTLVGFFGQGLIPSGTKDPFGLRRAAQGLVKTVLASGHHADLEPLLGESANLHRAEPGAGAAEAGLPALVVYLGERAAFVLSGDGHRPDTVDAVLARTPLDLVDARARAVALTAARSRPGFEELFTVFKRVANIAGSGGATAYDPGRFTTEGERALESEVARVASVVRAAMQSRDYAGALERVSELAAPLARFFEAVFVMDPDLELRENRLRLLRAVAVLVEPIGDFTMLQVEREGKA